MQGSVRQRNKTWSYCFDLGYINGKRKRKEKGGFRTKKEAEKALREALREYENTGQVFKPNYITLYDYMEFWMKEYVELNCKFNTVKIYRSIIKNNINPALGSYKLSSLNFSLLQHFINEMQKQGYSKSSLNSIFVILSEALKLAVYPYQYIKENPMLYVTKPKYGIQKKDRTDRVINIETFNKIIETCLKDTLYYIPFIIGYYTGFRIGEVLGLTWDNIDFDNNLVSVKNTLSYKSNKQYVFNTPKTATSFRTIIVSDTLIKILKQHKIHQAENKLKYSELYTNYYVNEDNIILKEYNKDYKSLNFVCTFPDGRLILYVTLQAKIKSICKKLNIQFTFHDLRHTHATLLIENGANMKDVQERLGHSNYGTTMDTYSHITEKMRKQTVKIFDEAIGRQII